MNAKTQETDKILTDLAVRTQNASLEAAAKVAALYGAPAEAIAAILRLKVPA